MLHCQLYPQSTWQLRLVQSIKKTSSPWTQELRQKCRKLMAMPGRFLAADTFCLKESQSPVLPGCRPAGSRLDGSTDTSILAQSHRQKFLEGRGAGRGRTFFQKGFPPRKLFFLQIFRRLPAVPQTKKSPMERGQKKTPSRCELQGGLEQSLAAAYFPT